MSIQVIRECAQGLVNYVANEMRRPDVAANLQNWHFAQISHHLDLVSNDLKSKSGDISFLKSQLNSKDEKN
jgi:hypothetical protein